jgi:hypothetical protein
VHDHDHANDHVTGLAGSNSRVEPGWRVIVVVVVGVLVR